MNDDHELLAPDIFPVAIAHALARAENNAAFVGQLRVLAEPGLIRSNSARHYRKKTREPFGSRVFSFCQRRSISG